jgi:hypothetical protein
MTRRVSSYAEQKRGVSKQTGGEELVNHDFTHSLATCIVGGPTEKRSTSHVEVLIYRPLSLRYYFGPETCLGYEIFVVVCGESNGLPHVPFHFFAKAANWLKTLGRFNSKPDQEKKETV